MQLEQNGPRNDVHPMRLLFPESELWGNERLRYRPEIGDTFEQSRSSMPDSLPATLTSEGWKRALGSCRQPRVMSGRPANTGQLVRGDRTTNARSLSIGKFGPFLGEQVPPANAQSQLAV